MENFDNRYDFSFEPNEQQTPPTDSYQPEPPKKEKKKTGKIVLILTAVIIVSALGGAGISRAISYLHEREQISEQAPVMAETEVPEEKYELVEKPLPQNITTNTGDKSMTPADVYAANVNSVVGVRTSGTTNVWGQITETSCSGTGFIFSEDGYIITNNHVIEGANEITVTLYNDEEYKAELIGGDADNDVALLKIEAENLAAVSVADMEQVQVGEQVIAIGNPLGELTFTMTQGYISALDREINTNGKPINMLQTDAAINSGNSGGPLFDMNGNVVGITTAKFSGKSTASGASIEGIGFAIPMDDVLRIVYELRENGYVTDRAYLGISVEDVDVSAAKIYNLPLGAHVLEVVADSCAERAGIIVGDIIINFDGTKIENANNLISTLNKYRAGDTVKLTVLRAGAQIELTATLDQKPQETETEQTEQVPQQQQQQQQVIIPDDFFGGYNFPFNFGW